MRELRVGHRGFKLFEEKRMDEMVGLDLPYVVNCHRNDRENLATIVNLM